MKTILFQGDSITDCARGREGDTFLGCGYAALIAADIGYKYPGEYKFVNRGLSGDRCRGILARMKQDIVDVNPDIISILVGINDVWKDYAEPDGVNGEVYEKIYDILIQELKLKFPKSKIIIVEPFTDRTCMPDDERWQMFKRGYDIVREKTNLVALKHNITFVPIMDEMTKMIEQYGSECFLLDGTHPSQAGHRLIANAWIKAFEESIR